jgi:hypothetical protein
MFFKTKIRLNLEFFKIRRMDYTQLIGSVKRTKIEKFKEHQLTRRGFLYDTKG